MSWTDRLAPPSARAVARWRHSLVLSVALGVVGGSASFAATDAAAASDAGKPHPVFVIRSPAITEASALAMSTVHDGLVYTANDSGDAGTVYVLDDTSGALLGRTRLVGADPLDVEALAAGSDGSLVIADIGDNDADHSTADLYRIEQPGPGENSVRPERVDLTYPGGARDAESVLYDAQSGRAFVVSKQLSGGQVYATPSHVFERDSARLRPVADAPTLATDATFLPGNDFAVVRTYVDATVYRYPQWDPVVTFPLPAQQQGESITAPPSGSEVWIGSEGSRSRVLAVPLPDLPAATPSSDPTSPGSGGTSPAQTTDDPGPTDSSSDKSGGLDAQAVATYTLVGAVGGLILIGVVMLVRRPR